MSTLASAGIDLLEDPREIARPEPRMPFRILIAGDFSAGAGRNHRTIEIDRDNFDQVMALFAPELRLNFANTEVAASFRELDDFHPDRLFERLEPFQALRGLRERLSDSATFHSAAAQLAPRSVEAPMPPAHTSGADLLREMMGDPPRATAAARARLSEWDRMLHDLVAPYLEPAPDPRQPEMIAQTDRAITGEMRAVLHHPKFQALEAAWRALFFLVRRLETGEDLKIYVLDLPQPELTAASGPSELRRVLADDEWGVIAGLYYFAAKDESALKEISLVARSVGAPFLAGVAPEIAGLEPVFQELRASAYARWIGLAMPRFLLRLPYGKKTSEIGTFAFEEMPEEPDHESYLWGHPAVACAYLLGETFTRYGWEMRPGAVSEIDGLPAHVFKKDGESQVKPCAETLLTQEAAELLLARGLMPLASIKGADRVRVVRFQSVAEPAAPLAGRWV